MFVVTCFLHPRRLSAWKPCGKRQHHQQARYPSTSSPSLSRRSADSSTSYYNTKMCLVTIYQARCVFACFAFGSSLGGSIPCGGAVLRLHHFRRPQNRRHRFDIASTPANIACQCRLYLILCRVRMLPQKSIRPHDEARCAVATLRGSLLGKRFLDGVEVPVLCQPLDGKQVRAIRLCCKHAAGVDRAAVQDHTAAAAIARAANQFCSSQMMNVQRLQ